MVKLRKQRRKKVYRHNVNRKRLRNKIFNTGAIGCQEIKTAWEEKKSVKTNLLEMGLSYDPNHTFKIPSLKKQRASMLINEENNWNVEDVEEVMDTQRLKKSKVAELLIKDAKAPRVKLFRLPKSQVEWITYLMDKYGNNYRAMAKDKKNYNQETWKQIRAKVKKFVSIPEQSSKYFSNAKPHIKALFEGQNVSNDSDDEL